MKDVIFTVDGSRLKGTLFFPPQKKLMNPGVLFIHGWASAQGRYFDRARSVAEKGAVCLTFDLRGHGKSEGNIKTLSRYDHVKDASVAFDFLASQPEVDRNRMGICGVSYGGYLASILSAQKKLNWLALRVPALYKDDGFNTPTATLIQRDDRIFSQTNLIADKNFALKELSKFEGSVLLVESEKDRIISHETIQNYVSVLKKNKLTYKVMKDADHELSKPEWKQEFITILSDWFEKQFKY